MSNLDPNRRPIQARYSRWAQRAAQFLSNVDITPNQISVASIFFSVVGSVLLLCPHTAINFILAALSIQGRLVCNLLDGMVAIEGAKKSSLGQLYNEFPDRIADSLLLIAAGYASELAAVGWFAALSAALTAYVRVFGGALGLPQSFRGPMAKQHRMATLTAACIFSSIEISLLGSLNILKLAISVIAIGSVITCITRTSDIARQLKNIQQ